MARTSASADRRGAAERPRDREPPLIAYLETSAFVKLLVPEAGSAEAAAIWLAADRRISSVILYPELRAAIARAWRMGRLDRPQLDRAKQRAEALWAAIDRVELTMALLRRAGELTEDHGLRAYDAVHLASLEEMVEAETVLVSADAELLQAARALGFTIAPPPA